MHLALAPLGTGVLLNSNDRPNRRPTDKVGKHVLSVKTGTCYEEQSCSGRWFWGYKAKKKPCRWSDKKITPKNLASSCIIRGPSWLHHHFKITKDDKYKYPGILTPSWKFTLSALQVLRASGSSSSFCMIIQSLFILEMTSNSGSSPNDQESGVLAFH
ncbi:hypothetical protein Y1Q_0001144 [Alligator mississippiensis]|uniref:Uncharacterized protein n=1 Tax=Alligator mississippiensis TaxID=8496 RepID=A0A151PIS3_ALLMI|nr:hypothetical protein Y1Q_0001144 [Alligator mississippiensis]